MSNFVKFLDSQSWHVFKALRFGYRKTIFDAMKVTYNTYLGTISGMSRKMMKMDCQNSAECQNWEKNDIIGINGIVLS